MFTPLQGTRNPVLAPGLEIRWGTQWLDLSIGCD
jgi:hypothetical protein